uniref:(northern house mosquito) hypothetical protein n=1 Tax=Culex pipiens TaxID=7175 RepID=A0A8D8BVI0_CULPI
MQSSTQNVTTFSLFLSILNEDAFRFILLLISPSTASRKTLAHTATKTCLGQINPPPQDHLMRFSSEYAKCAPPLEIEIDPSNPNSLMHHTTLSKTPSPKNSTRADYFVMPREKNNL